MPPRSAARPSTAAARRGAVVVLALAAVLGTGLPASAVSGAGATPAVLTATPSAAEVAAQRAQAQALDAQVGAREKEVADARARLTDLAAAAGQALEEYTLAVQAQQAAQTAHAEATERLAAAQAALDARRGELGRWASQTYRDGSTATGAGTVDVLLSAESTDDLGQRLAMLERVGRMRGSVYAAAGEAERAHALAAKAAAETAWRALETATAAETAKKESDRLVAEQRTQVAALDALLAQDRDAAVDAADAAMRMEDAKRVADARAAAAAAAAAAGTAGPLPGDTNVLTGPVGTCRGADTSAFPNGQIPLDALCPLWGAPGHRLRADAAHAYESLNRAYAGAFGEPLCVTDSYRSYDSQVRLKAAKPTLAATPGTSNHGWGTAVDLCGGIQNFGTTTHEWMRANAPLHGWFHPGWAQQGGSKPEPWHWEFGG